MRSNRWMGLFVAACVVAGLLILWNPESPGQAPAARAATAWEYETFRGNIVGANSPLKELGQQGWELCGVLPVDQVDALYIFKRPTR
jgi:hypothetical protein